MHSEVQIDHPTRDQKSIRVLKTALRWGGRIVMMGLAVLVVAIAYLSHVGEPSSASSMKFEGFIALPKDRILNIFDYMALSDRTIFVGNMLSGSVVKVQLTNDQGRPLATVSEQRGAGNAHGIAVIPHEDKAFVTRSGENVVDVFQPSSLNLLGQIPVADDADAIIYDPASRMIYVANGTPKVATIIDPEKLQPITTIPLGAEPEYPAADVQHGLIYQNLHDTNEIAAVDLKTRSVVGRWSLAPCVGPSGLALDPVQGRLYAVCMESSQVVVFSLEQHKVIAFLPVGGKPDSVVLDLELHRIYTAGIQGVMTVVEQSGEDYRILDNIETHPFAHTLIVDPQTHRVYLTYAALLSAPRIAVFSPKP
ncbi:YncE family protein [Granulicella arctica]|uniref:YncE family protein n=1 Tax=Granulicella arctica TaxID=940613 RepID=UPI0021E05A48|nr:YncE family protein [Granulicella arctica]